MGKFGSIISKDRKIYGNFKVLSPEGYLMFRCDEKKANWYLDRNLAIKLNDPLLIQLKFKPRGLGNHDKPFGLSEMSNICVNCGTTEFLTRHHVVPICYRRYFPLELKSHNFHDVLTMCIDCHEKYERNADKLKNELAVTYDAPINGLSDKANKETVRAIKNCNTLLNDTTNIPQSRISEISDEIRVYLGRDFNKEDLLKISQKKKQILQKTHGELVVEKTNDIQEFIRIWRKHFITHNECKFLPDNWSVDNVIFIKQ